MHDLYYRLEKTALRGKYGQDLGGCGKMDNEICCKYITENGKYGHCEYDSTYACKHPNANGFVLTATLNGARPANCPKVPGNAISDEEAAKRKEKESKRGESFRFGGLFHDYEVIAKEWYAKCYHCKKEFSETEKPYCRIFPVGDKKARFGVICRECAYSFGDGVIEKDGNTYYNLEDFVEE